MTDLNRVILIGRLANDVEFRFTPSGIAVATFRLAVNRPLSAEARQSGQEKQADFIPIVAWRQSAEYAKNYLGKGRLIAVEGRLQVREYQTQDGQRRRETEVICDSLRALDRPKEAGDGAGSRGSTDDGANDPKPTVGSSRRQPAGSQSASAPVDASEFDDIDDPFADN